MGAVFLLDVEKVSFVSNVQNVNFAPSNFGL